MYRDQYALAVLVDGKVQKEDQDGTVILPFETEYELRLKNKSRKKAVADIHIDGQLAAKGIVIPENGTIDLERFVTSEFNLHAGNKFKLVKSDDSRVSQPGESENGIVHVNFYPEKDKPVYLETKVIHEIHEHHRHVHCIHNSCPGTCWQCNRHRSPFYTTNTCDMNAPVYGAVAMNANLSSKSLSSSDVKVTLNSNQVAEDAATVKGSLSSQSFQLTHVDVDYDKCTTLQIKLKGVKAIAVTCNCGFKRKQEKFCPECGTNLVAA